MGAATGIASVACLAVAALVAAVALFLLPTANMTAEESDCPDEGAQDDCTTIEHAFAWTWWGERHQRDTTEDDGTRSSERTRTWAHGDWTDEQSDGAAKALAAQRLAVSSMLLLALAAAAVLVGRFTHFTVGIVGGVAALVAVLLAGLALWLHWTGVEDVAQAFRDALAMRAEEAQRAWNKDGPYWGVGLSVAAAAALPGLAGGILGLIPWRRDRASG